MGSYHIVYLVNDDTQSEIVVIVSPGEGLEDYTGDGYNVMETITVGEDMTSWPCDRALRPE